MGLFPSHPLPIRRSESGSLRAPCTEPVDLLHHPLPGVTEVASPLPSQSHLQIRIPQPEANSWTTTAGAASLETFHKTNSSQGVWGWGYKHTEAQFCIQWRSQSNPGDTEPIPKAVCSGMYSLHVLHTSSCLPFIKALERTEEEPRPKRSLALETV